jgi:phage shock protein C
MYCNACGQAIADQARFCSHCGRIVGHPSATGRLMRPRFNRKIAGVCAGIAEHIDLDASLVRLLWVLITLTSGFFPGIITYILAWIIIPEEPFLPPVPAVQHQQPVAG